VAVGVVGVAVYVVTSAHARARVRVLLEQAWQWYVHTARPASGEVEDARPAGQTQVHEPAPANRESAWAQPAAEAPVASPPAARHTAPEAEAAEEGASEGVPAQIDYSRLVDYSRLAAAVEGEADESPPRRRSWARVATVAGAACALGAIGAVSYAIWGAGSGGGNRSGVASPTANVLAAVSRPGAKRIPVAGSSGKVILVVAPDGRAALIVAGLAPAGPGKQFEAWVIVKKNPKQAGLFSGGAGTVVVPLAAKVPKGATVAVTVETAGGVAAPTGKPLFATTRPSS
jgi:Anti-sigma-K factor rskA